MLYVHVCVCMYICVYVCMYLVCTYVCMYVCMLYVHTYVCIYVCMYVVCTYACMYVCMLYVHVCVCMYICIYVDKIDPIAVCVVETASKCVVHFCGPGCFSLDPVTIILWNCVWLFVPSTGLFFLCLSQSFTIT